MNSSMNEMYLSPVTLFFLIPLYVESSHSFYGNDDDNIINTIGNQLLILEALGKLNILMLPVEINACEADYLMRQW